jgi:hypothetical protein
MGTLRLEAKSNPLYKDYPNFIGRVPFETNARLISGLN